MSRINRVFSAILLVAAMPLALADALVDEARERIDRGDAAGARLLLEPFSDQRAGEVTFDYALALAMLDSGDSLGATVVFERLLLTKSDFHGARIDLGRAYFNLGRLVDARRQFDRALNAGPPPLAARLVARYMAEIERIERRQKFTRYASVGTRAGYDSNVNSATELTEFLGFGLNDQSRERDSDFFEAALTAGGSYRLTPRLRLGGRASARFRKNSQASFANSDVYAIGARLDRQAGRQSQSLALDAFTLSLDGSRNSTAFAITGDWRFNLTDTLSVGPAVRLGQIRFQDSLSVKDVNQWALGAVLGWRFGSDGQGMLDSSMLLGRDDAVETASRFGRDVWLWNSSVNWRFSDTLTSAVALSIERSAFDDVFFEDLFTDAREDLAFRARGAVDWQFAPRWRLQHALSYRMNDTDIGVFEFERFEMSLGLRYVWY
ncbi:MAG: tetratricopeptide repeat protein [Pseudomonadota bacterium]